jgi:hypothetical protein
LLCAVPDLHYYLCEDPRILLPNSCDGRELALDLAIHRALEAHKQLLIEHRSDPLERRQLRDVRALLKSRDGAVGSISRLGDLLLGKSQLEAPLPQMRRNRADLTKGSDSLVFGTSVAIRGAAIGAALSCLDGATPNRIL